MASRIQVRTLHVRDLSTKSVQEIAEENIKNDKVIQLAALQIYHEEKLAEIKKDLKFLLKERVIDIDY